MSFGPVKHRSPMHRQQLLKRRRVCDHPQRVLGRGSAMARQSFTIGTKQDLAKIECTHARIVDDVLNTPILRNTAAIPRQPQSPDTSSLLHHQ